MRPDRTQVDQLIALQRVQGLLDVARLVGSDRSLDSVLSEIARTISEALGFQGVAFNLYRPAWDDFIVSTVHGSEAMCETLLGETYEWSVWSLPLEERFERRGAYFIPDGSVDWSDPGLGARYVPDQPRAEATDAWTPGDELFVPCRHSDGHLLGIVSVGEPVSGMRPSDDQLDLLVAMVSLTARALQGAQEAVEAARHRNALEQLLQVSSRLSEPRSIDEVLQEVCDGVAGALDFQKVMIELVDPETGLLTPRAVAGWDDVSLAPQWGVSVAAIRPLLDPAFEVEGCFLVPQTAAIARMPQRTAFTSTMNGRGPHAWDHHWLVVPLYDQAGQIFGRIWADDPADRLLPSPSRLQALRVFANQAMMAVIAAGHVEQLRAQADRDSLTGMLNRRAFMRELRTEIERSLRYGRRFVLAALRPRRVQADQRHRRASGGRPRARGRGRAARGQHPRQRLRLPHRRRRVRPAAARDRCRRGAGGRRADRLRPGRRQRARRRARHQLRTGRLPGRRDQRPRSSSAAPTRRSTRPSARTTTCTSRRALPERSYTRGRGGPRTRRRRHLERRALHALRRGDRRRAAGRRCCARATASTPS